MSETGVSIIIPVFNKIEITTNCIDHVREFNKKCVYEIIVVDNGSTDKTEEVLSNDRDIIYIRNKENLGISKAYNQTAGKAQYDILCFMHNDVFIQERNWISKIADFFVRHKEAGIVGLYGAKKIRRDGSFMGRGIVHAKSDGKSVMGGYEEVAVVDGLFMALSRYVYEKAGGFDAGYNIHYYDKDISLRTFQSGFKNYVIDIPFTHKGAGTRSAIGAGTDDVIREEMKALFLERWGRHLPADSRSIMQILRDLLKKHV